MVNKRRKTMSRISKNAVFVLYCFAEWAFVVKAVTQDFHQYKCDFNRECEVKTNGRLMFCCGECGKSMCCNNSTREVNVSKCGIDEDEGSSSMLGFIIGGMVASFAIAMTFHYLFKTIVQKCRQKRRQSQERNTGTPVATIVVNDLPPLYDDIQLYRKTDSGNTQLSLETENGCEEIKLSILTLSTDEKLPPSYSSIFNEESRPSVSSINDIECSLDEENGDNAGPQLDTVTSG